MTNPNQRVQPPFGDVFFPSTAATDRAAQILYAEQKQREAKQQAQNAALDEEFSKNLSGIRDADIPDLTKAYGEWKLANQQAMKQKNGVSPEQQLQVLKKKADLYSVINSSKQRKQYEDETGKGIVSNPDIFEDDAQIKLINHRKTPLSQLLAKGEDKYDYRYKGTNTDFQKMLSAAAGQTKQVKAKESPVDKDGLQTKITPVMYGNTPLQFKESLLSSLSLRKSGRDAAAIIAQTPVEVIAEVNDKFKAIPLERWQDMGVDKPQELIIKGDETPAERFAIHQAQLYALNNEPKEGTPIFRTNEAIARKQKLADDEKLIRLRNSLQKATAEDLIRLRADVKDSGDAETNDLWVTEYVDKIVDENKPTSKLFGAFPAQTKDYTPAPVLYEALGKPAKVKITKDGNFDVKYLKPDPADKEKLIPDESRNKIMTPEEVKLALGYKAATKKDLKSEMNKKSKGTKEIQGW